MSETIAITGKSVKLFKGHYTRVSRAYRGGSACQVEDLRCAHGSRRRGRSRPGGASLACRWRELLHL
ncbi:MAG: hypothetical protein ACREYE_32310 [Gammaproteobacteria bacterium]